MVVSLYSCLTASFFFFIFLSFFFFQFSCISQASCSLMLTRRLKRNLFIVFLQVVCKRALYIRYTYTEVALCTRMTFSTQRECERKHITAAELWWWYGIIVRAVLTMLSFEKTEIHIVCGGGCIISSNDVEAFKIQYTHLKL